MEKKDGSSTNQGFAKKVLMIEDAHETSTLISRVAKEMYVERNSLPSFAEIDRQQTIEKWRPLFENPIKKMVQQKKYQMPLFPKPNSKNSKRRERLNTAAGLPAKKRCFFRSLKRQFGKIPKEQRSAHVVVAPLDRNQEPIISAIFLVKELILDSLDGCSIYGCAAFNATMNGSSVIVVPHDFKKKDFGKKYSSGTITIR